MRGKSVVLSILVLFLFSAAAFAGEEGEQEDNGKTTVRTLIVDGVKLGARGVATAGEGLYDGTHFALKDVACDGSRRGLNETRDGLSWFAHETPMSHLRRGGRFAQWSGGQLAQTPARGRWALGKAWDATKWGFGHLW